MNIETNAASAMPAKANDRCATIELNQAWADGAGIPLVNLDRTVAIDGRSSPSLESVYGVLADARLAKKKSVLVRVASPNDALAKAMNVAAFSTNRSDEHYAAGVLDDVLFATFEGCTAEAKERLRDTFPKQIERAIALHLESFHSGAWGQAVRARKLSRTQYVTTLQNVHQSVRMSTRLLGLAVACAPTAALRQHFAEHLQGETNHELMIERDLRNLGESNEYLVTRRYPTPRTRMFLVLEQSLVAFERDPVLFMACPLVAESLTAHLDASFLEALNDNVRNYGLADPTKATLFYSAHIEADGGDDGHEAKNLRTLRNNIHDESQLGEFLTIVELAALAFTSSMNANIEELQLFSN